MSSNQKELFERWRDLTFKLEACSGIVQNDIQEFIQVEDLQQWNEHLDLFQKEFNQLRKQTNDLVVNDLGKSNGI